MLEILKEHTEREDQRFDQLVNDIEKIKDNHLYHIEKDLAGIHIKMAALSADLSWVKWGVVLVLGALVTGSIALIFKG